MKQNFQGWEVVAGHLHQQAESQQQLGEDAARLNAGQRASLREIATRIVKNGVLIADEVGMGKTRIAVEVVRSVIESGGRVAILIPPGLGYQWQAELHDGGVNDVKPVLRSLHAYLKAWADDEPEKSKPWFELPVVMVSHAFANWRLGGQTIPWRWALLPELYACWRRKTDGRLPRGYHGDKQLEQGWVCNIAAESIADAIPSYQKHPQNPARRALDQLLEKVQWPMDSEECSTDGELRKWLEKVVGIGLGVFDLVIIDEAHKSRGTDSGLSRLLDNVIMSSESARRLALTATPVELDVSQWSNTLSRLGLDDTALGPVQEAISQYAHAVKQVRRTWQSNAEARAAYKVAASHFQNTLSPYLLRRDKREDPDIQRFRDHSKLPINAYRRETEITVETNGLSESWRKAICAAESLSVVTRQSDDPVAKRLRLTLGNGHGITALLDQIKPDDDDKKQEEHDAFQREDKSNEDVNGTPDSKREERAKWWLNVISQAFTQDDNSLYTHPAINAAVEAIEKETQRGEKVLVFGRFTRPLRALVDLLNAREMLRRVQSKRPWPQTKVHVEHDGKSEWPAVRAAHCQLSSSLQLEPLDEGALDNALSKGYERDRRHREKFRDGLIPLIEQGWLGSDPGTHIKAIFETFKRSVETSTPLERTEERSLALVARAVFELMGKFEGEPSPPDCAQAFCELILAVSDRDDADASDGEIDDDEATERWEKIEGRLREEYDRPQGGFARLMFGETKPESRRMIQLAFNRPHSFPRVLVAQSIVGREGLNLHKSCRIVVMLHPEWNPGVVEQQIGRVDRVDSHWCNELKKAIADGKQADQLPRIEVRPVIFKGTYDEHNWQVLRVRWDDLRAQLHGIVIPPSEAVVDQEHRRLIDEISEAAPNFSPTHTTNTLGQAAVRETESVRTPH